MADKTPSTSRSTHDQDRARQHAPSSESASKTGGVGQTLRFDPPASVTGRRGQEGIESLTGIGDSASAAAAPFQLRDLAAGPPAAGDAVTLALIQDVELDLKIELGRTQMVLEDVLKLHAGAVVTLDKLVGDPVDIVVNGRLIARGEVLVLNDNFCVRVTELIAGEGNG